MRDFRNFATLRAMRRIARRYRRAVGLAMVLLHLSGARVIAVSEACEHDRVFFTAGLSFKALAKSALHQQWKQAAPTALGESVPRYSAKDIELAQRNPRVLAVIVRPPSETPLADRGPRLEPLLAFKLPADLCPVQPTHLHSKL
jgi:hypothetical protein